MEWLSLLRQMMRNVANGLEAIWSDVMRLSPGRKKKMIDMDREK
jgi:hypothetical protein